jgi:uncharacterized RDD family membrane protein YckC
MALTTMKASQIDSRIEVVTPENIAFQYRVAGPFRRGPAYLLDVVIRVGILVVVSLILQGVGAIGGASLFFLGQGTLLVVWFGLSWFYGGFFETYWNGQTPGKWAAGIRVVSIDGQPINALQAVMRNVLRAADALPVVVVPWINEIVGIPLYQIGLIAPACNSRYQRLGDLACGTMVIFEERPWQFGVARVTEPEALRLAELIPPDFEVSRSLSRVLSVYVDRRRRFSFGRRAEIARHLAEPLRVRFNLPPQTNGDLLLCALYQRAFFGGTGGAAPKFGRPANTSGDAAAVVAPIHLSLPAAAEPNLAALGALQTAQPYSNRAETGGSAR